MRLRGYTGSAELSLVAYVKSAIISRASSNKLNLKRKWKSNSVIEELNDWTQNSFTPEIENITLALESENTLTG